MNTATEQNNNKGVTRSVTDWLHPRVYAVLGGLTLWFVLWIWSFAGSGVIDLLLVVSGFLFVVGALVLILSRVGRQPAMDANQAEADNSLKSFHDWAASDFDTGQGRLSALQAATLILLPIAAAAVGMTAFGSCSKLSNMVVCRTPTLSMGVSIN